MYRTVVAATLTLLFVVVGFALVVPAASAQCGDGCPPEPCGDGCPPPSVCGGEGQPACLCHNIGGPRELGANCDATGCTFTYVDSNNETQTLTVAAGNFLGILIGAPTSGPALTAHLNHGDGIIIHAIFNPPLHLASQGLNHQGANVECLATRAVPQPPDHGN
jgi:hypothetical protein